MDKTFKNILLLMDENETIEDAPCANDVWTVLDNYFGSAPKVERTRCDCTWEELFDSSCKKSHWRVPKEGVEYTYTIENTRDYPDLFSISGSYRSEGIRRTCDPYYSLNCTLYYNSASDSTIPFAEAFSGGKFYVQVKRVAPGEYKLTVKKLSKDYEWNKAREEYGIRQKKQISLEQTVFKQKIDELKFGQSYTLSTEKENDWNVSRIWDAIESEYKLAPPLESAKCDCDPYSDPRCGYHVSPKGSDYTYVIENTKLKPIFRNELSFLNSYPYRIKISRAWSKNRRATILNKSELYHVLTVWKRSPNDN